MSNFSGIELNQQLIAGTWRDGNSDRVAKTSNPYDDSVLAEIQQASAADVDETYEAAQKAQPASAEMAPAKRSAIIYKAAELLEQKREEFVELLIRGSGSTRGKANLDVTLAANCTRGSASFPARRQGRIAPSNFPGKESRVSRVAAGVAG